MRLKMLSLSIMEYQPKMMLFRQVLLYRCHLGKTYPKPIINLEESARFTRQHLWNFRRRTDVRQENQRILARHVAPKT